MSLFSKLLKRKKVDKQQDVLDTVPQRKDAAVLATAEGGRPKNVVSRIDHAVLGVLRTSHITEKTSDAVSENKYAFRVNTNTNKRLVKQAVEARYGVTVIGVNILNTRGKERRRGRQIGWKPGFKKAIVTLREGERIEIQ